MMLKFLLYISMVLILINESTQKNLLNAIAKNVTIAIKNLENLAGHSDKIKTNYAGDELIDKLRTHAENITKLNYELYVLIDKMIANQSIDTEAVNNYVDCIAKHYEGVRGSGLIKENDVAEVKQWSSCFLSLARQFKAFDALLVKMQSMYMLIGGYNFFYLTDVLLRNLYYEVIMKIETGTT
uniref:SJCHGC02131 protein n=1 Tax=Schistosoma japonicum TaxID=6182 RepID=Q5DH42_SCHJA|nr:SJCHGC02131 protein [Schistosoma japonicum]